MTWSPAVEGVDDFYYARLPFSEAQKVFSGRGPSASSRLLCTVGWHGTQVDGERGSFAIVRTGSPLEGLVGRRVRVTTRGGKARLVYAFVHAEYDLEQDLSLTRRGFQELGLLGGGPLLCTVEAV